MEIEETVRREGIGGGNWAGEEIKGDRERDVGSEIGRRVSLSLCSRNGISRWRRLEEGNITWKKNVVGTWFADWSFLRRPM
jgi:hypothetical protein